MAGCSAAAADSAAGRSGAAAANGLPFGGIPSELQEGVDQLLADEPDHGEPQARFTPRPRPEERRPLTLRGLLTEYPRTLAWAAALIVVISVTARRPAHC